MAAMTAIAALAAATMFVSRLAGLLDFDAPYIT
jgi:hypothetical protein